MRCQDPSADPKAGEELDHCPQIPVISIFLKQGFDRLSRMEAPRPVRTSSAGLDRVFRECLIEVHGNLIQAGEPRPPEGH
jgi:hypothetical protein